MEVIHINQILINKTLDDSVDLMYNKLNRMLNVNKDYCINIKRNYSMVQDYQSGQTILKTHYIVELEEVLKTQRPKPLFHNIIHKEEPVRTFGQRLKYLVTGKI